MLLLAVLVVGLFLVNRLWSWSRDRSLQKQIETLRRQLGIGTNSGLEGRHRWARPSSTDYYEDDGG